MLRIFQQSIVKNASVLAACLLFALSLRVQAEEPQLIEMGTNLGGHPPFCIKRSDGDFEGIIVDFLRKVAQANGYRLVVYEYPSGRNALMISHGKIDVLAKAREWVPNPDDFDFTDPLIEYEDKLFSHSVTPKPDQNQAPVRIGGIIGYVYPGLNQHFQGRRILRLDAQDQTELWKMLTADRIDYAVMNPHVAAWTTQNNPALRSQLHMHEGNVGSVGYRLMFNRKRNWKPFIEIINQELRQMKANGSHLRGDTHVRRDSPCVATSRGPVGPPTLIA